MNVGTNGIIVDQHGHVLLIKRNDTHTFAPPGGGLDIGELPPDGTAREVQEETGLIVLPVRLVTLTHLPLKPNGYLMFTFRCLLRGGEITTSEESPVVGFFKSNPLPRRITSFHRERLKKGLAHAEEHPLHFTHQVTPFTKVKFFILRQIIYRWLDVKRKLQGKPTYQPPPNWEVAVYLLCPNEAGEYLWQRPNEKTPWKLPGGIVSGWMTPWQTAVTQAKQQTGHQLHLGQLNQVYLHQNESQLSLVFTAKLTKSANVTAVPSSWFASGNEPTACQAEHCQITANTKQSRLATQFYFFE
ncbi:MAG: NUDIX domain-containing protein [Chloroflexi bacterium]|nr:NUDIX domain-containing protein [Chloroflexota bacterium]